MKGKLLLVIITVFVLCGAIGGLVVWVKEEPAASAKEPLSNDDPTRNRYIKHGPSPKI